MSKYLNNLSVRLSKEQRVLKQLTNKDALMDALISLYNNATRCQQTNSNQENTNKFIQLYKPIYHEINKSKISLKDFQLLHKDSFAEGAFGKVSIVKSNHNNKIYAMKTSSKSKLIRQMDRSSPMEERLILSNENEEWLPSLYASFQDEKNLYLVMEYAPGGDLQGLLERRSYKPFSEEEARFYCAELILAVERVHQLGYMHRDIKPGNILIDDKGHIKLGDLGSCISIETKDNLLMVGTMPYVSPEMCNSEGMDSTRGPAYGPEVDWWSVGIVLYELLFGERPFTGTDVKIQMSLLNPKVSVQFDPQVKVSKEAKDLLSKLLSKSKDVRLSHGAAEIKSHPFFKDINWKTLHSTATPPFVPSITTPDDVTFFSATNNDDDDEEEESYGVISDEEEEEEEQDLTREYPFIGYTYISYNTKAAPSPTPSRSTSNQEFIAQLRQKLSSPEPKQWEDERNKLKQTHEAEKSKLNEEIERLSNLLQKTQEEVSVYKKLAEESNSTAQKEEQLQLIKELQQENSLLSTQSSSVQKELDELRIENSQLRASNCRTQTLQSQLSKLELDKKNLQSAKEMQDIRLKEVEADHERLERTVRELHTENSRLTALLESDDQSVSLQAKVDELNNKLSNMEKDLHFATNKCTHYEQEIEHYQEQCQKLRGQMKQTQEKLTSDMEEMKHQHAVDFGHQSEEYSITVQRLEKECAQLKQELQKQQSVGASNKMKKTPKSLPIIPASVGKEPYSTVASTPDTSRSIMSAMWQRDRESLQNAQRALEDSENQLSNARKQVIRLKQELKCYQTSSFEQDQQQQNTLGASSDKNSDIGSTLLRNRPDFVKTSSSLVLDKKASVSVTSDMEKPRISIMSRTGNIQKLDAIDTSQSYRDVKNAQGGDKTLLRRIEQERSFIESTERTIAARARLSSVKGEMDQELERSLERARTVLSKLEEQLKEKVYLPSSDFLKYNKKPLPKKTACGSSSTAAGLAGI